MIKPIHIGNLKLENNIFLAPMAGVNCPAFRLLCKGYGAGLVYTQMYDSHSLVGTDPNNFLQIFEKERPVAIQLVGSKPEIMQKAAEVLNNYADVIDLNFGCPDADVLANKAGAFFLKHPEQLERVVKAVLKASEKPVTAKIRSGWEDVNALKVAKMLEDYSIAAISIHPRTKKQGFSGKSDWNIIKQLKEKINIPIIGNGDVTDAITAKKMFEKTNCDAIMVGRAAIGNPLIFENIIKSQDKTPSLEEKKKIFKKFLIYYEQQSRQNYSELKQHALWFFKSIRQAKSIKHHITKLDSKEELLSYIDSLE